MKIVHTADWHIGATKKLLPEDYLQRQIDAIGTLFEAAHALDGVLVVSGDVFHNKHVTEAERNALLDTVESWDRKGVRSYFINGNHDIIDTQSTTLDSLAILSRRLTNTTVATLQPMLCTLDGGVTLLLFPPACRHDLDTSESMARVREWTVKAPKGKPLIVATHAQVAGAVSETGHVFTDGAKLGDKRVSYWALGDIHRFQKIAKNAYYPGNPVHHRWGEDSGPEKGYIVYDTDAEKVEHVTVESRRLLTVTEVKGLDALHWYRLRSDKPPKVMPQNVLEVVPLDRSGKLEELASKLDALTGTEDPLEGLAEILADSGLSEDKVRQGLKLARSAM